MNIGVIDKGKRDKIDSETFLFSKPGGGSEPDSRRSGICGR
jgi:hypothetical protein